MDFKNWFESTGFSLNEVFLRIISPSLTREEIGVMGDHLQEYGKNIEEQELGRYLVYCFQGITGSFNFKQSQWDFVEPIENIIGFYNKRDDKHFYLFNSQNGNFWEINFHWFWPNSYITMGTFHTYVNDFHIYQPNTWQNLPFDRIMSRLPMDANKLPPTLKKFVIRTIANIKTT